MGKNEFIKNKFETFFITLTTSGNMDLDEFIRNKFDEFLKR